MKNTINKTGYFANEKNFTKVHIVGENEKPVCGVIIGSDKKFQFNAYGIMYSYLECEHCKKIAKS